MNIELKQVSDIEAAKDFFSKPIGLDDFQYEVSKKLKGIKFKERNQSTLWAYREGESYAIGYIGFGDFRDNGDGEHLYTVWSPNIINNRYGHGSQMHMAQAKQLKKGVSNALKYLRPLSVKQTASISTKSCRHKVSEVVEKARGKYHRYQARIAHNFLDLRQGSENALQQELQHLVDMGHEFLDKELGDNLRNVFNNLKEYTLSKETNSNVFTFVEATKTITGRQVFRVATNVDTGFTYGFDVPQENISVYSQEELPEELAGKLSVLSMIDPDNYVEGVGYRAAANVFYLR